jgi:hypothetical protein
VRRSASSRRRRISSRAWKQLVGDGERGQRGGAEGLQRLEAGERADGGVHVRRDRRVYSGGTSLRSTCFSPAISTATVWRGGAGRRGGGSPARLQQRQLRQQAA